MVRRGGRGDRKKDKAVDCEAQEHLGERHALAEVGSLQGQPGPWGGGGPCRQESPPPCFSHRDANPLGRQSLVSHPTKSKCLCFSLFFSTSHEF